MANMIDPIQTCCFKEVHSFQTSVKRFLIHKSRLTCLPFNAIHSSDMSIIQKFLTNQIVANEIIIVMTPYCPKTLTLIAYAIKRYFTKFVGFW